MNTLDQQIWRERVQKERGAQQKFDVVNIVNAETSNLCNSYGVLRPMVRDNSSPQQLKKRGFYMVDSSYTIPCNPNSMRDSGPLRNAEYILHDPQEHEYLRRSQQNFRNTAHSISQMTVHPKQYERMRDTQNSRCNHTRPISSYGGNPANMNGTHSTGFFSTFSRSSQKYYEPNIVDKVEVVRVNDYTKNISSSIFTPSLRTVVNQQQNQNHYHKRPNNDRNHQAVVGDRQFNFTSSQWNQEWRQN
eukprot:403335527